MLIVNFQNFQQENGTLLITKNGEYGEENENV